MNRSSRPPRPPRFGGPRPPGRARPRAAPSPVAGLGERVEALDGRPFAAYRSLRGEHPLDEFVLVLDPIPGDPAAGPARARLRLSLSAAGLPPSCPDDPLVRLATEDFVARHAARAAETLLSPESHAAPGSGRILVERPGRAIVDRTACRITEAGVELRLSIDLPAWGRTVRGRHARALLTDALVRYARGALLLGSARRAELEGHVRAVARHAAIRDALRGRGLVAFVPDGAQLEGLREPVVAAPGRAVEFEVEGRTTRGLGIPGGVTLVVGGAGSGAPELVRAIAAGVDPCPPGEPAHGVVTAPGAAFVPAEQGARRQRERLHRAVEAGARLLLFDEDRSAPSFLGRDPRLSAWLETRPAAAWTLAEIARDLDRSHGVATIVAAEATGELVTAADVVIVARDGRFDDPAARRPVESSPVTHRYEPAPRGRIRVERSPTGEERRAELAGAGSLRVGGSRVIVPEIVPPLDDAQRRGLAFALARAGELAAEPLGVAELLETLERELDEGALEAWGGGRGDLARPSRVAIAETLHRLPSARIELE